MISQVKWGVDRELAVLTFECKFFGRQYRSHSSEGSEAIAMTDHMRWRNSYNSALHACGNRSHEERKADLAIQACVRRLLEITSKDTSEREEIRMALNDLKVLKILYGRYH